MRVYFGLGTNLGDKEQNLRNAVQQIEKRIGRTVSLSAFFKSSRKSCIFISSPFGGFHLLLLLIYSTKADINQFNDIWGI